MLFHSSPSTLPASYFVFHPLQPLYSFHLKHAQAVRVPTNKGTICVLNCIKTAHAGVTHAGGRTVLVRLGFRWRCNFCCSSGSVNGSVGSSVSGSISGGSSFCWNQPVHNLPTTVSECSTPCCISCSNDSSPRSLILRLSRTTPLNFVILGFSLRHRDCDCRCSITTCKFLAASGTTLRFGFHSGIFVIAQAGTASMISESSELQYCLCFESTLFYCMVYLLKVLLRQNMENVVVMIASSLSVAVIGYSDAAGVAPPRPSPLCCRVSSLQARL